MKNRQIRAFCVQKLGHFVQKLSKKHTKPFFIISTSRTKEMLAYLVDRDGTECRKNEIIAALFEDELNIEYYKKLRQDLIRTFSELGIDDVIAVSYGGPAIKKESVKCDYYDYLESENKIPPAEYMVQYSWQITLIIIQWFLKFTPC